MKEENIIITTLDDGMKIVTQKADFNNVFIGAWVKVGLINESDEENGLSHFLEHMLFKGTKNRTALQLSDYIEKLGGECNAYTSTEKTVIHTSLLPEHWKFGVDFLADVIQNSNFPKEEIEREREVIIQEIAMYENDPMSEMFTHFMKNVYAGDSLGRTILGPRKNIQKFTRDDLINYFNKWYTTNNMVISACGNIDHEEFVNYVKQQFIPAFRIGNSYEENKNNFKIVESKQQNIFSQSQFILATESINLHSNEKDKLILEILSNIIDGGMSCRLFQEIREKHGLAYQVGFMANLMEKTGFIGVHASLDERNIDKAVKLAKEVLESVKTQITDDELEKAKNTILYTMASNYDSCARLASSNGSCVLFNIEIKTYEQIRDALKEISKEDVFKFAQKYIPDVNENKYSLSVMTPYEKSAESN